MLQETVADIMSNEVIYINMDTSLNEVYLLFKKHQINNIPVVQSQRPVGIINRIALIQQISSDRYCYPSEPKYKNAGDFMNHNVTKLLPDSGIQVAINAIKCDSNKVACVIIPGGKLVGILTLSDLINKYLNFTPYRSQQSSNEFRNL